MNWNIRSCEITNSSSQEKDKYIFFFLREDMVPASLYKYSNCIFLLKHDLLPEFFIDALKEGGIVRTLDEKHK